MQSSTVFVVALALGLLFSADAQLTFSSGWNKRGEAGVPKCSAAKVQNLERLLKTAIKELDACGALPGLDDAERKEEKLAFPNF